MDSKRLRKIISESISNTIGIFTIEQVFEQVISNEFDWYDLYPGYSEEIDEDEETMFDTKEKALQYANQVIDAFKYLPNPTPIYRCIKVKQLSDIDMDYIGSAWSMYKENALSFGSHNSSNVLLSGTIEKQYVDWSTTLRNFVIFSGSDDIDNENEIVVDDMYQIKNIEVKKLK